MNKPAEPSTTNSHPKAVATKLRGHNVMKSQGVISEEHDGDRGRRRLKDHAMPRRRVR